MERCLQAVLDQTRVPDEIIVVDDGATLGARLDPLADRIRAAGIAWQVLSKPEPGLTAARNLTLRHAGGQIVQFFDDDAEPERDYLAEVLDLLEDDHDRAIAVLGGHVIEPRLETRGGLAWRIVQALAGWWGIGRRAAKRPRPSQSARWAGRFRPTTSVVGAGLAVRRDLVHPPGFEEALTGYALGEDREIALRMASTHLVGLAPRARTLHRTDTAGRPDPERFGFATAYNYCYIASKNLPMGVGEWVVVGWGLAVLVAARLCRALIGLSRRHLLEAWGTVRGAVAWLLT